jgi:hypothetical protein
VVAGGAAAGGAAAAGGVTTEAVFAAATFIEGFAISVGFLTSTCSVVVVPLTGGTVAGFVSTGAASIKRST